MIMWLEILTPLNQKLAKLYYSHESPAVHQLEGASKEILSSSQFEK